MKRNILLFAILVCSFLTVLSKEIPLATARNAAICFYRQQASVLKNFDPVTVAIRDENTVFSGTTPLYYIFNFDPQGFILIAADDAVMPVLGYSFDGGYSVENSPEACRAWMKQYEDQISYAISNPGNIYPLVTAIWEQLTSSGSSLQTDHSRGFVAPLITSNWNQDAPYNAMCPADPGGPGGHAYAGCVPTCMGQVMYYYRWPWTGTGSYSYEDPTYGTLSANFDTTTYDWNTMADEATGFNPAIALLLYHLGVSCDLVYGPNGSGMYNHKAAYSLRTFFKYAPQTQYLFRDSTTLNWDSVLIAHLDRKMPMYYAGWSVPNINGHAFVCDGYQDSCFFHFNFGWSGQNNGYFYTSDLTPGGYNFNLAQEVIINCFPDTVNYTYPLYATGSATLTSRHGSLEDGSGPMYPYRPNTSCSWLIDPQDDIDSVSSITLHFMKFSTAPGDIVTVYDGGTTSDPVMGQFDGDTLPEALTTSGNRMLITFTSNPGSTGEGFYATYDATTPVWCSGTTTLTADTAEISDGSFRFNYHNSQVCKWKITPENGQPVTLAFRSFNTEANKDVLKIYDLSNSALVASISGHYSPDSLPPPVTVESGQAFLMFTTDGSVTDSGWELYYPKSNLGIGDPNAAMALQLIPNPASRFVRMVFHADAHATVSLTLTNMQGSTVIRKTFAAVPGINRLELPLEGISPGIYALSVNTGQAVATKKLIIQ